MVVLETEPAAAAEAAEVTEAAAVATARADINQQRAAAAVATARADNNQQRAAKRRRRDSGGKEAPGKRTEAGAAAGAVVAAVAAIAGGEIEARGESRDWGSTYITWRLFGAN